MYFMLECQAPPGKYPALLTYIPDRPGRAWMLGRRFDPSIPEPVQAIAKFRTDSVLTELISVPVPLMSRRLYSALVAAGVTNLDFYLAEIRDQESGQVFRDHLAFNVIGAISATDLSMSEYSAPDGPLVTVDFLSVSISKQKVRGALLFRLAESVNGIVVHESVKNAIEAAGINTLTFIPPEEWVG